MIPRLITNRSASARCAAACRAPTAAGNPTYDSSLGHARPNRSPPSLEPSRSRSWISRCWIEPRFFSFGPDAAVAPLEVIVINSAIRQHQQQFFAHRHRPAAFAAIKQGSVELVEGLRHTASLTFVFPVMLPRFTCLGFFDYFFRQV